MRLKKKTFAKFQQKILNVLDDRRFQIRFRISCPVLQPEELKDIGLLENVLRFGDFLSLVGEIANRPLISAKRESLVKAGVELAFEIAQRPALLGNLDLIELRSSSLSPNRIPLGIMEQFIDLQWIEEHAQELAASGNDASVIK